MPLTGTLRTWHDDKGFGFIAPSHGGREVFVHVSAFPRDGTRPAVGERLIYELGRDKDGRPQASRVTREALASSVRHIPPSRSPVKRRTGFRLLLAALLVGSGLLYAAKIRLPPRDAVMVAPAPPAPAEIRAPEPIAPAPAAPPPTFRCDGRKHCSQMTSCAEAKYFLSNCPGTEMDGDHDGIPCERQWCTSPLAK
ncbi:cold shock domain-containing protein [Burkholderiaceae bacterium UC74_6]